MAGGFAVLKDIAKTLVYRLCRYRNATSDYGRRDIIPERILTRLIKLNEYKRRQAPIGIRVTHRAFGRDWRYPITSRFAERL
ncbi:NAD+ synthase, partial [Burkholderia multivorans]|nr:NAD+ synthase [Burkholderia multivorans]